MPPEENYQRAAAPSQVVGNVPRGAYGVVIPSVEAPNLLTPAAEGWREIDIVREGGDGTAPIAIGPDEATFPLARGGSLTLRRVEHRAVFRTPYAISDDELVHPYLAPVGAVFARWNGRESLHAGAFVAGGRAWAVVGTREAGKSTLLAALHAAGHPIVTDDVLVIDDGLALAGPRAIDLRAGAAAGVGLVERPDGVREDSRERVRLPPVPAEMPLAGWIVLAWGDALGLRPLPVANRFAPLVAQRSAVLPGDDPVGLLDLVKLPAYELVRPRDFSALRPAVDRLAELAAAR